MQLDMLQTVNEYKDPSDIRVLLGCEKSGVGRQAFLKRGFDAYSCDLQPADDRSNRHFTCDIREVLDDDWDVLIVCHPPCTRLANSGVRWIKKPPPGKTHAQIQRELEEGAALFSDCWNASVPHVAVENPIMHRYAKSLIKNYVKQSQIVQPWHHGEKAFKATAWWLRNLPNLVPTNKLTPPSPGTEEHKKWSFIHRAAPGPERSNFRSRTFQGHADAFAEQWGDYVCNQSIAAM